MHPFFEDLFNTKAARDRRVDRIMSAIKNAAISVTPVKASDYIAPAAASTWITVTETTTRPFYRAARPARRWK